MVWTVVVACLLGVQSDTGVIDELIERILRAAYSAEDEQRAKEWLRIKEAHAPPQSLISGIDDSDPDIRRHAIDLYREMRPMPTDEMMRKLKESLREEYAYEVRRSAADAVSHFADHPLAQECLPGVLSLFDFR